MTPNRVLFLALDGFDFDTVARYVEQGRMPVFARLLAGGARFSLDHGASRWAGLAGEHFATGLSPAASRRFSAVRFDPAAYAVVQEGAAHPPFAAALAARTVVYNPTYTELALAPSVRGVVGWGGVHDPGATAGSRPDGIAAEIEARFGTNPGAAWTYALTWQSAARTRAMGEALAASLAVNGAAARWLLHERLPDWDLAIVASGETHSALEAFWHGIDPCHPLHAVPSSSAAAAALAGVYTAFDRFVGTLADAFPDATLVVSAMHGMGPNVADLPGMLLLPELLYRDCAGVAALRPWSGAVDGTGRPALAEDGDWNAQARAHFIAQPPASSPGRRVRRWARARLHRRALPGPAARPRGATSAGTPIPSRLSLDWMPATYYRPHWPAMRAFALPAFYDGRIRINLRGREAEGKIAPAGYADECRRIEALLAECRDADTGERLVARVETARSRHPFEVGPSEPDLVVFWRGAAAGLDHPRLGRIGPFPYRRTGGHTGGFGFALLHGRGIAPGFYGMRSAFDVVPTVIDLLGETAPAGIAGATLLPVLAGAPVIGVPAAAGQGRWQGPGPQGGFCRPGLR